MVLSLMNYNQSFARKLTIASQEFIAEVAVLRSGICICVNKCLCDGSKGGVACDGTRVCIFSTFISTRDACVMMYLQSVIHSYSPIAFWPPGC